MRVIVNNNQYNKILKYQQSKNNIHEGIVNYIYDSIILYESKLITETNIRKNNVSKILKNTNIDSIVIDMFRGNLTEVNIKHLDNMLEIDVTLPKNINHTELKNIIFLEMNKPSLLIEQTIIYGLDFEKLSVGDTIAINYLIDKLRKSLSYSDQQIMDKLLFIDGDNTFKNDGVLNIDTTKFNDKELSTIIKELEKGNNTNYVLSVDKNGEEIKGIGIDFDNYIALSKPSDDKIVNTDDPIDNDDNTNDDFEEVDVDEVPDGSFTSVIPTKLYPVMYLISDMESGHNYNIQGGEESPSVTLTDKTIKQVSKGGDYGTNAKGRWQLMPKYMLGFAKDAGLKGTDKFSKINQDKMAMALIKGWENWDCKKFGDELAQIWAPVPVLYDQQGNVQRIKRGQSFYKGVGSNRALTSANKFESALRKSCSEEDNKKEVTDDTKIELNKRNFHKIPVGDNLWRSGQMTLEELEHVIKTKGIKNIVRMNRHDNKVYGGGSSNGTIVKPEEEKKLAERLGVNYQFISAHKGYQSGKGYVETTNKVQPILNKGNTLIHCTHGADRTGGQVGRFMKDNSNYSEQKLWNYTTQYNDWCNMSKSKFEDGRSTTKGGFDAYAQSFIDDIDYDKMKELCNKSKSEEGETVGGSESSTKDGKIKILIIGDSHSVDNSINYSRKLLNKKGYSGKIIAKSGEKPKWMYDELLKVRNKIKDYDWFIVFGGGNASYRSKTDNRAITNLSKIYDLIIKEKGGKANIIAITPPTKKFAYHGKFPSNQTISDWVMSQKSKTEYQYNLSGLKKEHFRKQREKNRTTNKMVDTWYHLNGDTHNELLQYLLKDIK